MERVTLSFFAICIIIFVVATEGKYTVVKRVGYRLGIPWMGVRIPKMIDIFFSFYSSLLFSLLFKELTLNMFVSVLHLNKTKKI